MQLLLFFSMSDVTAKLETNLKQRGPMEFVVQTGDRKFGRLWVYATGITWVEGRGNKDQYSNPPEMTWEQLNERWRSCPPNPAPT